MRSDIVERLRGIYRVRITDGLGPAGGEEPNNPNEYVRTFQTPPIQHEGAAEIERLRAENVRLKAGPTEDELDTARSEGYEEGYSEGQGDAKSAHADLWSMLLGYLKKHDCEPASDDGNGHNAHQVMDAVFEREANIRADSNRLAEAENARLRDTLYKGVALVARYRRETPLGNQPHMIAHVADDFILHASELLGASS